MATRIEVNCETGEVQEIELTAEEVSEMEAAAAEAQAAQEAAEEVAVLKAEQRKLLLDRLGITEDEAKLLLA